jgi:hypothetical protein
MAVPKAAETASNIVSATYDNTVGKLFPQNDLPIQAGTETNVRGSAITVGMTEPTTSATSSAGYSQYERSQRNGKEKLPQTAISGENITENVQSKIDGPRVLTKLA